MTEEVFFSFRGDIFFRSVSLIIGGKLKSAAKHRKSEHFAAENQVRDLVCLKRNERDEIFEYIDRNQSIVFQLADQRRRLGGAEDSAMNVRDFLDDSPSEVSERILYGVENNMPLLNLLIIIFFFFCTNAHLIISLITHSYLLTIRCSHWI